MTLYIHQIFSALYQVPDTHYLVIKGSEKRGYTFSASETYNEVVAIRTQHIFKKIFNDFPIQEILEQCSARTLTKEVLRHVFVQMAVFGEKGPPFNFSNLDEFEQVFLDQAPGASSFNADKAKTSGKGFEGLCEKVYLQWHHYFATQQEVEPHKIVIRQAEFLTSRMADREFQEGEYIYLGKGEIFQVDRIIVREGAYVSILKNIADPQQVKIICRGTAMRRTATDGLVSGLNDLQYEIGNGGVQAVWPKVFEFLRDEKVEKVHIYGKSLGGAHAQRLAVLVMQLSDCLLTGLTTVGSVGVGPEAEALFKETVELDARYHQLPLTVIRNGGDQTNHDADYIPCIGGEHLGSTLDSPYLDVQIYYIHPSAQQIGAPKHELNIFQKGMCFTASFSTAHVRQTTMGDFSYQRLDDRETVQSELRLGTSLEGPRRWVAYHNEVPFSDFVRAPLHPVVSLVSERIAFVVSSIFLLLLFVGFMTCLVLQPGSIVYQGKGIILTLPTTLLMAGGGVVSLLMIAIGSCAWWRSLKKSTP